MGKNKYISLIFILFITFSASFLEDLSQALLRSLVFRDYFAKFQSSKLGFGPVWSFLYLLMSIAIWKVWIVSFEKNF